MPGPVKFKCPRCASTLRFRKSDPAGSVHSRQSITRKERQAGIPPEDNGSESVPLSETPATGMGLAPGAEEEKPEAWDGPFIPEDKIIPPEDSSPLALLEDFDQGKPLPYEEDGGEAEITEWTHYSGPKKKEQQANKIHLDDLPPGAADLQQTLAALQEAETFNLRGEDYTRKKRHEQAIGEYSRALAINPDYVDALINRGDCLAILGRFNEALADFNHALKLHEKTPEIYNKRGAIYLQNNMHDQAIKDFTAALILSPMYSDAYLNRGRAYLEKERPEEARSDFMQAIGTDPHPASYNPTDRLAGWIYSDDSCGDHDREAAAFNRRGLADLENEKLGEAVENFTRAIGYAAGDASPYSNRGRTYMKLGRYDEALMDFNQGIRFDPLNAFLYYLRAQAWKAKDDPANMGADLKISCELGYEPACIEYRNSKSPPD